MIPGCEIKTGCRWWQVLLCILILPSTWALAADAPAPGDAARISIGTDLMVDRIQVVIDGPADRQESYAAMARQLIRLSPGEPITPEDLQASIEALKLSQRFSVIHVDSIPTDAGETLIFTLTPQRYIEDIRIHDNYPLFEKEVLNQITLYPGNPYTDADLSAQADAIAQRYRRAGYIDPEVKVAERQDAGNTVIIVDIDKGPHYVLGALTFEGNRAISDRSLKWRMQVWRTALLPGAGRFSEFRLKKDMERLLEYYRKKGFADAELSYRIDSPEDQRHASVAIRVEEGPRYTIDFTGNQQFWDLTLKKDVVLFDVGNRSHIGVRRSIQNMLQRYREAGFLEARIEAETTRVPAEPADIRRVQFVIQEGPATIVDAVEIAGNHSIDDEAIKDQMLTRPPGLFHDGAFVPETLEEDLYAVTTLYMQRGFQEREVASALDFSPDRSRVDVTLQVDEGPRTTVRSLSIDGLTVISEEAARAVLNHRIGDPFRQTALADEKESITSLVSEKGYPHATVRTEVTFNPDHTQADIAYQVDPGPRVTLENISIAGNLRTAEKVIRRELGVEPHSPLSLRDLHEGQRRLRDLQIFHGVDYRILGLKEAADTVSLFVDVEESEPYFAQVSAGYESDSGFFGRTKIGDRNLWGLNKELWAGGELSQTGYRVETRLTEPRFLGTRVAASIGAFNEKLTEFNQPFGTRTTGGSLGFSRDWGKHLTSALSFSLERRDQFSVEDRPPGEADETTRTIFVTTPYLRYDSRDSFVRPTRGILSSLNVDISKGVQDQLDDFVRYVFDTRYYRTPIEGITLAGLARVGHIVPYNDSSAVPDDQLFFQGGIRDVRGFKENLLRFDDQGNPVGGKTALAASLEARIELGLNLELTTFFDLGSVRDALVEEGSDRFRASVGLGLRYLTPIGPMGLLYGHKLDREEGESAGRFHLSIGYSF